MQTTEVQGKSFGNKLCLTQKKLQKLTCESRILNELH